MINLTEVPEQYQYQVERFLTYYHDGAAIAERYLSLVTSPDYNTGGNRAYTKPDRPVIHKGRKIIYTATFEKQQRLTVLTIIRTTPGLSAKKIADNSGIPLGRVRQHIAQLKREGIIEGFLPGKPGYFLTASDT